jgi:DNA invertase Pin-like site-specific DNA recombinase
LTFLNSTAILKKNSWAGGLKMSKVAYVRVSCKDQNTGRQIEALKQHGIDKIFEEKISGKNTNRPQLLKMLEWVREGDTVYVESFSRLARNMLDLLKIIDDLSQKSVGFVSLKENIDTTTPAGRLQLGVFAAIYQFERECSKERQREGIDLALKEGRAYGRPKHEIDAKFLDAYKTWKSGKITAVEAMKQAGVKKNTWYNRVKELEQAK